MSKQKMFSISSKQHGYKCIYNPCTSLWIHNKGSILSNTREHNWINVVTLHLHKPDYSH